jgi:hypothetical protein
MLKYTDNLNLVFHIKGRGEIERVFENRVLTKVFGLKKEEVT